MSTEYQNLDSKCVHIFAAGPSLKNALSLDFSKKIVIGVNGVGLLGCPLTACIVAGVKTDMLRALLQLLITIQREAS